ncbi:hypothetical protein [Methylobacterium marchantiae]|uniref:Porin n=1 Tax=Methylobacterium marchantiae TaxID=600331 RepID=A0ABW3X0L8_9HYPH|nr:hypothetical protein AIGOOFII_3628 [Methylobacterium marchantiae]
MGGTAGTGAKSEARRRGSWIAGMVAVGLLGAASQARAEAPIKSPQDAACRNEARAKVFVTPDPNGIGLYALGRQIYMTCMARPQRQAKHRRR